MSDMADDRTGIIIALEKLINEKGQQINDWFAAQYAASGRRAPFYASVDLRHSCSKIVPVDTNLFPAGFNHLSPRARSRAIISFRRRLADQFPNARKILVLAEGHTRNAGYLQNVWVLAKLLADAGAEVRVGRLPAPEIAETQLTLETLEKESLTQFVVQREGDVLYLADGWQPDVLVMNNDLSGGLPPLLEGLSQPIVPSPELGWHKRRKSQHFDFYNDLAGKFAADFGMDEWRIRTLSHSCGSLDFRQQQGMECVAKAIEAMLEKITAKYAEYGVSTTPYVYIKADAGTYGMGIMSAFSPDDVLQMNKKLRNKMQVVKDGAINAQVLIQEGVPTMDRVDGAPAEPMMYAVDGQVVGGAFRVNPERDEYRNLNAAGMFFTGMCDRDEADSDAAPDHVPVRLCNFQVYGLITRLANLAAAME